MSWELVDIGDPPNETCQLFDRFGRLHISNCFGFDWAEIDAFSVDGESQELDR